VPERKRPQWVGSGVLLFHPPVSYVFKHWENDMQLFPVFAVANLEEAVQFYCQGLGFEKMWSFGEPAHRAGEAKDGIEIHLDADRLGAPPGPSVVYCHIEDAAAYYLDLKSRGLTVALELKERPWGMRDFRIEDPFGNRLGFASKV
jgi:uncharacterized glyoxalase superfamily protein PhnB